MESIIIAISTDYCDARKVCELIGNRTFKTLQELREEINNELPVHKEDINQPEFFSLSEFMDECNDQYFNLDNNFISYVKIGEKE